MSDNILHKEQQGQPDKVSKVISLAAFEKIVEMLPNIPDAFDPLPKKEHCLSSPHIHAMAQYLTDLIQEQLNCRQVILAAIDIPADHFSFIAASGLTCEQAMLHEKFTAHEPIAAFISAADLKMLQDQEVVILPRDLILIPSELKNEFVKQIMLGAPLTHHNKLIGVLLIGKDSPESNYSLDEILFAKSIARVVVLVISRMNLSVKLAETYACQKSLREINQRISTFLDIASHELKTPLTATRGNIQVVQRRLQNWKRQLGKEESTEGIISQIERIEQPLEEALKCTRFQQYMIDDMIDVSAIQSHTLTLRTRKANLISIVKNVVADEQKKVPEKSISLEDTTSQESLPVMVDTRRIEQVINNYLINAIKYSADNQPIKVQISLEDSKVCVSVQDAGPGISLEEQARIWERFYRTAGIVIQHEMNLSLGLGLYLCDNIIQLHHGQVGVKSSVGNGATFWFTLPIVAPDM